MDSLPRPPLYHPSNPIDLSLKVSHLLVEHTGFWNSTMLKRTFVEDDVHRILSIQPRPSHPDSLRWGFTPFGSYTLKSGYKLLEDLRDLNGSNNVSLPPLEKLLWSNLWKTKTSPKLRHFLWRALWSLGSEKRLRSRSINVVATHNACGHHTETICHVLFSCPFAQDVWNSIGYPLPPSGFSVNAVFLNFHYLLECSKNKNIDWSLRRSFPWVLWYPKFPLGCGKHDAFTPT